MKTDIQIAQEATLLPIAEVAKSVGIGEDLLEPYGRTKAKIDSTALRGSEKRTYWQDRFFCVY